MKRPSVLLSEDHTIVLEGLRRILDLHFNVVGSVQDGRALVAAAKELRPDVIVTDISMPLLNGIEAARQIKKMEMPTKIVFLTMHPDVTYATEAFRAGASGYVLKNCAAQELVTAIQEAFKGRVYVTPLVAKEVLHTLMTASSEPEKHSFELTPR